MAEMPLTIETNQEAAYVHAIDDVQQDKDEPWFTDIQRYLQNQSIPHTFQAKIKGLYDYNQPISSKKAAFYTKGPLAVLTSDVLTSTKLKESWTTYMLESVAPT